MYTHMYGWRGGGREGGGGRERERERGTGGIHGWIHACMGLNQHPPKRDWIRLRPVAWLRVLSDD